MILDVKTQQYICALAATGSYHKAAAATYTSQPNLSIKIKKLEQLLGLQLFYRKGKKVEPTYCGQLVIESCQKMLNLDQELEHKLSLYRRNITGSLRIGTYIRLSPIILPPLMAAFVSKYPQVDIKLSTGHLQELLQSLEEGSLDLVICNQQTLQPKFAYLKLKNDHLLVALPQGHPALQAAQVLPGRPYPYLDLQAVQAERLILQDSGQMIRTYTDAALAFHKVQVQNVLVHSNIETGVQLASQGLGVAFCMESYVHSIRPQKPVCYCYTGDLHNYAHLCACYAKEHERSTYFTYCLELLKQLELK